MWHDVLINVIGGLVLAGVTAIIIFGSKFAKLPRQMIINQAALFRLLRSNKLQGTALAKIAVAMKRGDCNGETDDAVKAVGIDQIRTDEFFKKIALTAQGRLEDLLKEEE